MTLLQWEVTFQKRNPTSKLLQASSRLWLHFFLIRHYAICYRGLAFLQGRGKWVFNSSVIRGGLDAGEPLEEGTRVSECGMPLFPRRSSQKEENVPWGTIYRVNNFCYREIKQAGKALCILHVRSTTEESNAMYVSEVRVLSILRYITRYKIPQICHLLDLPGTWRHEPELGFAGKQRKGY